tara:strand:- start:1764 stop:2486 length:723 start_codon:yes stop_codon:yes gene_type:complete
MSGVLSFNNISPADLEFSQTKVNQMGGQSVYVNTKGSKVRFELPKGRVPFGLSIQSFDDSATKISLDQSLGNPDDKNEMSEWQSWLNEFDQHILSVAHNRSEEWFKKKLSKEILEEFYKPCVSRSKDDKYPPTFKMKIPVRDEKADVCIYDDKENQVGQELVEKGCHVRTIVELQGVWFVNKMFGVTWKLLQMQVFPVTKFNTFAFSRPVDNSSGEQVHDEDDIEGDNEEDDVYDEEPSE